MFNAGQNALIDQLLAQHPAIVACSPSLPEEVLGWVCRSYDVGPQATVHYVYVKHAYRRLGIASFLVHAGFRHSHLTTAGEQLAKKLGSLFDPYTLTPHRS